MLLRQSDLEQEIIRLREKRKEMETQMEEQYNSMAAREADILRQVRGEKG